MTHPKRPRDGMFEPAGGRGESAAKGCRYSGTKGGESSSSSGKRLISLCSDLPAGCSFSKITRSLSAISVDIARE